MCSSKRTTFFYRIYLGKFINANVEGDFHFVEARRLAGKKKHGYSSRPLDGLYVIQKHARVNALLRRLVTDINRDPSVESSRRR